MSAATNSTTDGSGPWAGRCALGAALAAVPLVLFGGTVTTLGAGMAVQGWLIAEGHFLAFFPVEKWFRDLPTFVEHTHRLFGILVGLFALGALAAAWRAGTRARTWALVTLLAVIGQGALGGFRVLENSPELAFVHGAVAQAVFALLCWNAFTLTRGVHDVQPSANPPAELRGLRTTALLALALLYGQVVLGAWYRHGLRPEPVAGHLARFALHGLGAVVAMGALAALVRRGTQLRERGFVFEPALVRAFTWLPRLLLAQILLGGLAWAGFRPGAIGPAEWLLSIAHVLGGAFLLADTAVIAFASVRLARSVEGSVRNGIGQPALGVR
jgi:cytochrome c oxidase assembly protein subunit 15